MKNKELKIKSEQEFVFSGKILEITVLGGLNLEGLDRMRVTLKIRLMNSSLPSIRHNLDLYNDNQLDKFSRRVATKLEVGLSVVEARLSALIDCLEEYRLEKISRETESKDQKVILTQKEKKSAEKLLQTPNLLEEINKLIGVSGVVGEELNRLRLYVIYTTRKMERPLHAVCLGASGVGKTHLQEKVGDLIPDEERIELTTLSENAFYYFERRELSYKLILIEDLDGVENSFYPLRELQSKRKISKTIAHKNTRGETKAVHLVVEGPVCVSGCTTKEQIYEDNSNRSFLIYLDESETQDDRIMNYQRKVSAGKIDLQAQQQATALLKNSQRLLEPIKVINPFAQNLCIPKEVLKPRRTNAHYLAFIEAITFMHQFQREQKVDPSTGELFIETTIEDIKLANELLKETLLRKSDQISGACRNYFERLKLYLNENDKITFTNREIRQNLRISGTTLRRYQNELLTEGLIFIKKGKKATGYTYELTNMEEFKELKQGLENVLNGAVNKLGSVA